MMILVLMAVAGGVGAALFWVIRRPDKDHAGIAPVADDTRIAPDPPDPPEAD